MSYNCQGSFIRLVSYDRRLPAVEYWCCLMNGRFALATAVDNNLGICPLCDRDMAAPAHDEPGGRGRPEAAKCRIEFVIDIPQLGVEGVHTSDVLPGGS